MNVNAGFWTEIGISKKVNQDALLIKEATFPKYGKVVMGVLCDGMGGLDLGEEASKAAIKYLNSWFIEELPQILRESYQTVPLLEDMDKKLNVLDLIQHNWLRLVLEINHKLKIFGEKYDLYLGTTLVAVILIENHYLWMNIGDSRLYHLKNVFDFEQLSHDHSVVQQMIDKGEITKRQAPKCSQKNVLLQCVGAGINVNPDFGRGEVSPKESFLLCCDGFWRKSKDREIRRLMKKSMKMDDEEISSLLSKHMNVLMNRWEEDNISAIMLSVK